MFMLGDDPMAVSIVDEDSVEYCCNCCAFLNVVVVVTGGGVELPPLPPLITFSKKYFDCVRVINGIWKLFEMLMEMH
ncbi:hypothetical protein DERP_007797 [Dermatophagoides pteronyssinus]|uniref:Uncharacterized protein n=1 Tax=Dermatophagoides pteronyssinus TaxID=6956 RepID=A0ABQ8IT04_DERPT|nr:hypothetical protein DERP_007797 [Dermatophagoides pteronyssinus]